MTPTHYDAVIIGGGHNGLTCGKQSGVSVETIRFYEKEGLIEKPERKESGYRQFNEEAIKRLAFIRKAKSLGFTLNEIQELLSLKSNGSGDCENVKQLAGEKLIDIEQKINSLKRMKRVLNNLVDQCPGNGAKSNCPILEALDKV